MSTLIIAIAAVLTLAIIGAATAWTYSRQAFWVTVAGVILIWLVVVPAALEAVRHA